MVEEIWKDVEGFEGLYQVSSLGRVKRLKGKHCKQDRILSQSTLRGYRHLTLKNDSKQRTVQVHRLVAETFIPNPDNLPTINHRDENPSNNCVENLEWCTQKYNCNYGNRNSKIGEKSIKRPIMQLFADGTIKVWESAREAGRYGYDHNSVYRCCAGIRKTYKQCKWQYVSNI